MASILAIAPRWMVHSKNLPDGLRILRRTLDPMTSLPRSACTGNVIAPAASAYSLQGGCAETHHGEIVDAVRLPVDLNDCIALLDRPCAEFFVAWASRHNCTNVTPLHDKTDCTQARTAPRSASLVAQRWQCAWTRPRFTRAHKPDLQTGGEVLGGWAPVLLNPEWQVTFG